MPNLVRGAPKGRPVVLVVDSNAATVEEIADAVGREGYAVLKALTFEDGRQLWRTWQPDVLVVDIRLGQYNGLQLLMRARSDRPDITGVVTSPIADAVLEAEAIRFGGTFLIKPVSRRQLLDAIRSGPGHSEDLSAPAPDRGAEEQHFESERRVGHRRRRAAPKLPWPETLEDRRKPTDRRQIVVPGYQPERRIGQRRSTH